MKSMKKILSSVLIVAMIFSMMVMPVFAETGGTITKSAPSEKKITIVHTNDTHARVKGDEKEQVGFAKIGQLVADLKSKGENVILMDAGDTFHGETLVTIPKGQSAVDIMNIMEYSFMAPGNHDFNYGQDRLLELAKEAKFQILSANVIKEDGKPLLTPNAMVEIDGVKVGIFGLSTPETATKTNPLNVKGLTFKDPVVVAKEQVKELKAKGAQVIIALSHLGIDPESKGNQSYSVRDQVDGIDLIIDGHSHTKLTDVVQVKGKAQITSAGSYTNAVGVAEITVGAKANTVAVKNMVLADFAEITGNEATQKAIDVAAEAVKPLLEKVVGKTEVVLEGAREVVRAGESNLSMIAADAMRDATGADIAFTNGGGVRDSIKVGNITMNDVVTVFPFGNYIVTLEVTGENLVKALEHGTRSYPELTGSFPQVSGITYTLDCNSVEGARVKDVKVAGIPVDMEKTYSLATNDFMAVGGDGYAMFGESKKINEYSGLDEILAAYIGKLGTLTAENTKFEPRFTAIEKVVVEQPTVEVVKYTVKSGDMLWKIAEKFNTTWQKLAQLNGLTDGHKIYPGQIFVVQ